MNVFEVIFMCKLLKFLLRMENHFLVICCPDCHSVPRSGTLLHFHSVTVSGIRHRCAKAGMGLGLRGKGLGLVQRVAHLWFKKKHRELDTWAVQGNSKTWSTFDS